MPAEPLKRLRLRRSMRLQHQRDFARVRERGQRLALGCLIANWHSLPEGTLRSLVWLRANASATGRTQSRAALLRESFRLHQNEFKQPVELVLVARASIAGRGFAGVEKDFLAALKRAGLLKQS